MGGLWAGTPSPSPNLHHNPKGLGEPYQNQMVLIKGTGHGKEVVDLWGLTSGDY